MTVGPLVDVHQPWIPDGVRARRQCDGRASRELWCYPVVGGREGRAHRRVIMGWLRIVVSAMMRGRPDGGHAGQVVTGSMQMVTALHPQVADQAHHEDQGQHLSQRPVTSHAMQRSVALRPPVRVQGRQLMAAARRLHASSHRRQASAQTRQCSIPPLP